MKSIGQVISAHRQKQGWSLERLAKETNIPLDYVRALEENKFELLPTAALVQGYVQLIAQALHVPQETALAFLRRDLPNNPVNLPFPRSERQPLRKYSWLNPQLISTGVVIMVVIFALSFLWSQWSKLAQPPKLEVVNLANQTVVTSPVLIQGNTSPDSTLTINTQSVSLDPRGNFQYELELPTGERTIVVEAIDSRGQKSEKVYFVTVE